MRDPLYMVLFQVRLLSAVRSEVRSGDAGMRWLMVQRPNLFSMRLILSSLLQQYLAISLLLK